MFGGLRRNLSRGEQTVGSRDCAQRDEICFGTVLTISRAPRVPLRRKFRCCFDPEVLSYFSWPFSTVILGRHRTSTLAAGARQVSPPGPLADTMRLVSYDK